MKAINSRIRRLQDQLCPDDRQPQRLWVVIKAGYALALDQDRCVQILDECGFLPTGRFGVVNLCGIPDGLNAEALEKYLRTNGAEAGNFGASQMLVGPGGAIPLAEASSQAQIASDVRSRREIRT